MKLIFNDEDLIGKIDFINNKYHNQIFINSNNSKMKVVGIFIPNKKYYVIKFIDNNFPENKNILSKISYVKSGVIKNPYQKSILNIGAFGDVSRFNLELLEPKQRKYLYDLYRDMIKRIYNPRNIYEINSYDKSLLDNRWFTYENFLNWVFNDKGNNFHYYYNLDKDLIKPGNKIYGPDTCIFLPDHLNKAISINKTTLNLSQGVIKNKDGKRKYGAVIRSNFFNLKHDFNLTFSEAESFLKYAAAKHYILKMYAQIYFNNNEINLKVKKLIENYEIIDRRNITTKITLTDLNNITIGKYNKSFKSYNDLYDFILDNDEELINFKNKIIYKIH